MHRRDFLKYTGPAGGTLALEGAAAAGYISGGADKKGYTGWGRAPYANFSTAKVSKNQII